jgi:hypothetical protein
MILLELLSSLVPLALIVGIVVLVVRVFSKQKTQRGSGGESVGVFLRRLFVYLTMLVTLALSAVGVGRLISTIVESGTLTRDAEVVALYIAFVVVALPVFVVLGFVTRHHLRTDPMERTSTGWAFYLTVALTGSLITAMSLTGAFLSELFDGWDVNSALLVNGILWVAIWAAHWAIMRRQSDANKMQFAMVAGSAVGFLTVAFGVGGLLTAILDDLYTALFFTSVVDLGTTAIVGTIIMIAVGAPVWWLYWFRNTLGERRSPIWLAYVLLVGVLGGVVAMIVAVGTSLFALLQWFIGDPAGSAADQFQFLPVAIGAFVVGGSSWLYHGRVLGEREERSRNEVDRVYDYLLSGSGLVVAASGLVTLVAVGIDALGAGDIAGNNTGDAVAAAITLLVVGGPLWWRYWSTIQRYRHEDPRLELASPTRRVYLFLLFGFAGLVALVDLVVLVTMLMTDVIEGTFGAATISNVAVPLALAVGIGAVAWYHYLVFREDRADAPKRDKSVLREVIFVSSNGADLTAALSDRTGVSVRTMASSSTPRRIESLDELLSAIAVETHPKLIVIEDETAGYEVVALDA